jgi:hypothetical protein
MYLMRAKSQKAMSLPFYCLAADPEETYPVCQVPQIKTAQVGQRNNLRKEESPERENRIQSQKDEMTIINNGISHDLTDKKVKMTYTSKKTRGRARTLDYSKGGNNSIYLRRP